MKKLFAALMAIVMLCSLCGCAADQADAPATEQSTDTQETTGIKELPEDFRWLTYAEYLALSSEEQQAYYEAFPTPEEYMIWFNTVAKEHNQSNGNVETDGNEGQITQPTEPAETPTEKPEAPTEAPVTPTQKPEIPNETTPEKKDPVLLTYEEYLKLSPALQQAYYESFSSIDAYMNWYNAAAEEYNKKNENSTQVDGNVGQVTQPTEPAETESPSEETTEKKDSMLDGYGSVGGRG